MQNLHDLLIQEHVSKAIMSGPKHAGEMIINGRSARLLGLAAISPPLLLAEIHRARVPARTGQLGEKELDDNNKDSDSFQKDNYETDVEKYENNNGKVHPIKTVE